MDIYDRAQRAREGIAQWPRPRQKVLVYLLFALLVVDGVTFAWQAVHWKAGLPMTAITLAVFLAVIRTHQARR